MTTLEALLEALPAGIFLVFIWLVLSFGVWCVLP
jgi:hypothetical protein